MQKETVLDIRQYASLDDITEQTQQEAQARIPAIEAEIGDTRQTIERVSQRLKDIRQREAELAALQEKAAELLEVYGKQVASGANVDKIIEEISTLTGEEGTRKVEQALLKAEATNLRPLLQTQERHLKTLLQDRINAEILVEEIGVCLLSQEYNRKAAEFAPIVQQLWEARQRLGLTDYHLAKPWNHRWDYCVFESIPRLDFRWNSNFGSVSGPVPNPYDDVAFFRRTVNGPRPMP